MSQVQAENISSSIDSWLDKIESEIKEIKYLGKHTMVEIRTKLQDEDIKSPIQLEGLQNVWCLSFLSKQGFGLINIIKTEVLVSALSH